MLQDMEVGLKRSANLPLTTTEIVLMVMGEVDIGIWTSLLHPIVQVIFVDHWFYSYGHDRSGHRSQTSQFFSYTHDGLYIFHPRFPLDAIPRGVKGENPHQNIPYHPYPSISPHLIQSYQNIIITTCHLILIQACHHTKLVSVHIELLLLCIKLL